VELVSTNEALFPTLKSVDAYRVCSSHPIHCVVTLIV